ncbi:hypothetical protein E0765_07140 [Sulfuricurvum sp. IAE1]|uniref:hypothetical protein n=1 Tax=Sulfuricurvum sp. IAE1 TaxID=2546102 RepID=UPI001043B4C6|nr:hypothetical protein [Sulfuricurvum sp. IAE1]TDA63602.1 hypothetical protein E0765_07140 [Sulfuricurvum sp. IAE1]
MKKLPLDGQITKKKTQKGATMKTINKIELSAILAGLRLLQTHGYPVEYEVEGEMTVDEIDELCEAINCGPFSSLPLKEEEVEIWQLVSDTQYGTNCDLYTSEDEAKNAFITTVMEYSGMLENLGDNTDPTYDEALAAWEQYTEECASNLDTVFVDVQTVKFAVSDAPSTCPHCGSEDVKYDDIHIENSRAYQDCWCGCGATWNEAYAFSEVVALNTSSCTKTCGAV